MSDAEAHVVPDPREKREMADATGELCCPVVRKATIPTKQSDTPNASGLLALDTLKYSLLGPSLLKAGQESVDQTKVSEIIYNASKGSKFFDREEERDKTLSSKIEQILLKKAQLDQLDLTRDLRLVDALISRLDNARDLSQYIVHVDCDAFYASVELLSRPELADIPFAVGGGVLSTCNYAARKYGCRSGMAGFVAKRLCPQLVLLKPDFNKYSAKAQEIRQILAEYDPRFESASIDEAYLNITQYCAAHGMSPAEVVSKLRCEIAEKTNVTVSAGIAANTRLAKICSNMNKPNGQFVLANDRAIILEFMKALPCRKVNGVGRVFERELAALGINTCGDVFEQRMMLSRLFGEKACHFLVQCYLGLGRTRVQPAEEYERKSVGTESTFSSISDSSQLRQKLQWTAEELEKDLRRAECKGRTLVLKVKLHTFEVHTRQAVVPRPLHLAKDLYRHALPMLTKLAQEIPNMTVRLIGLRCTHLVSTKRPDSSAFFGIKLPCSVATGSAVDPAGEVVCRDSHVDSEAFARAKPEIVKTENFSVVAATTETGHHVADEGIENHHSHAELGLQEEGFQDDNTSVTFEPWSHGEQTVPDSTRSGAEGDKPQYEVWSCPVCLRPQPADERQFNSHIDACLSRQTILEAVQETVRERGHPVDHRTRSSPEKRKRSTTGVEKRESRRTSTSAAGNDRRQKKLCFRAEPTS